MTNYDSNQINHCIMLIHITFMGVYCIYVYMYIFTIINVYFYNYNYNVDVYIC